MINYTNKEVPKSFKEILLNYEIKIIKGCLYIHDLDSYIIGMHNCLTVPLKGVKNDNKEI